jgi:hypothetical protein
MPGGRHRFEFVGKEPLVLWVVASPLFANTAPMLTLDFGSKYFFPKDAPKERRTGGNLLLASHDGLPRPFAWSWRRHCVYRTQEAAANVKSEVKALKT